MTRNLAQYPITTGEKIAALREAIRTWEAAQRQQYGDDPPIGGITGVALDAIMSDLAKQR